MKLAIRLGVLSLFLLLYGCKYYSFTGISLDPRITTFQVNFFQNRAAIIEPGIDLKFTNDLQDLILNQTSLELVTDNGDIIYEGEITQYYIAPITATSQNTAAQNRLTITVAVRFYNTLNDEEDLDQRFTFYFDYDGAAQPTGAALETIIEEIYSRLTQDIFNATLAKW